MGYVHKDIKMKNIMINLYTQNFMIIDYEMCEEV